jgi:MoxR-like ATPase
MRTELQELCRRIVEEVDRVVVGKAELKKLLLVGLLSGGHVLVEGLPGTAKTTTAKVFAHAIGGDFKRIQFAPDTLPSDVTGFYLYQPNGSSSFIKGPLFANFVLADELNRTTPRTQAALVEGMQEGQVTVDGVTHPLPQPMMVIGCQLPYGGPGTYPLTAVQADRFILRVWSGLPSREEESRILAGIDAIERGDATAVARPGDIMALREEVMAIHVSDAVADYALALVEHVRRNEAIMEPLSPRATISLYKTGRALAFLSGRDYVLPDDLKYLFPYIAFHRVVLTAEAEAAEVSVESVLRAAVEEVPVPREL